MNNPSRQSGNLTLDEHIGRRVRQIRQQRHLSLEAVGEILELSAQQVSRFELGRNRIGAAQLYRLSRGLDVPVSWFFRDYRESEEEMARLRLALREDRGAWQVETPLDQEQMLLRLWRELPNERQRAAVMALLESLSTEA